MKKTTDNQINEEMLVHFFDAKDDGKSFPDALSVYGESLGDAEVVELRALWDLHGTLVRKSHNISPSRGMLMRALEEISAPVTVLNHAGYVGVHAQNKESIISKSHNLFMNINWKIMAPLAVVLIALVASIQSDDAVPMHMAVIETSDTTLMSASEPMAMEARQMAKSSDVPVSGDVDELVSTLIYSADQDVVLFGDASADIALISADSQAINDLNSAYDENTF